MTPKRVSLLEISIGVVFILKSGGFSWRKACFWTDEIKIAFVLVVILVVLIEIRKIIFELSSVPPHVWRSVSL